MALRDKLTARSATNLEPGEQLQQVLMSQTGVSPWFIPVIGALIALLINKYYVVAVTDRAIVLQPASKLIPSKLKSSKPAIRLPRTERFDVNGKLWGTSILANEKHYIHRRFFGDCAAADGAAPAT